ncbi:iron complex transport system permease protein [Pedobacter cryoconitis]|uniref:Iron complex transport system permease protein n=1 Tax=Pedobacter cryoconitis TaxID=188932 RepID=A0A7W8YQR4_9SPHI|nr:iron ABC transporter permease [Pedobacter cryoconitis]MBB5620081.1 iron complex transport system permease protein [Pedobacter cryoconitis]
MKPVFFYCLLTAALLVALSFSLGLGAMDIPVKDVLVILLRKVGLFQAHPVAEQYETVIRIVRLPRVILGVLVGAGLGISGAAVQGIFRNPLAEPGLIGISAGASLIAVAIIALEVGVLAGLGNLLGYYLLAFGAFAGAGIAAMLVYQISRSDGKPNVATMLLAGIAINALAGALTGLITYLANEQQLRNITFWMLGSLAGATWETVLALLPFVLIPVVLLPFMGKALNAFALGEAQADHLGLKVNQVKRRVVILATMAVGAAVAVSGVIGFVGLLVPHTIRLFIGVDNKYVLPASALLGALIMTLADMIARTIVSPVELPIGVITALLGTPLFLYILIKDKKKLLQ